MTSCPPRSSNGRSGARRTKKPYRSVRPGKAVLTGAIPRPGPRARRKGRRDRGWQNAGWVAYEATATTMSSRTPGSESSFARPRRLASYAGQCRSAVRKKKLMPASKAAETVLGSSTIPRQNGFTESAAQPSVRRSPGSARRRRFDRESRAGGSERCVRQTAQAAPTTRCGLPSLRQAG